MKYSYEMISSSGHTIRTITPEHGLKREISRWRTGSFSQSIEGLLSEIPVGEEDAFRAWLDTVKKDCVVRIKDKIFHVIEKVAEGKKSVYAEDIAELSRILGMVNQAIEEFEKIDAQRETERQKALAAVGSDS